MYKNIYLKSILIIVLFTIVNGCNGNKMKGEKVYFDNIENVTDSAWKQLAETTIYFGHQSVGDNIIDGIGDIIKNRQIELNIKEIKNVSNADKGIFAHSKVGKNHDPYSKMKEFKNIVENGIGNTADIAFFKFCFVDINQHTDVEKLFNEYVDMMTALKSKYKKTTFLHVTVPLIKRQEKTFLSKIKGFIKEIIGKSKESFFDDKNNIARNKFNKLFITQYEGKEPIFDLAKIESTYPDGTREQFVMDGKTYYALVPDYTEDAGHLYGAGREKVSEQLLLTLVNLE